MKRFLIIPLILAGCQRQPTEVYQGHPEAYWVGQSCSGDVTVRLEAVKALGHFKSKVAQDVLRSMLNDPNIGTRYYAAESLWYMSRSPDVIPALRSVINDQLGWSYRDRLLPLLRDMGETAKPLVPDIQKAIDNSPNSRVAKWQDCLNAIAR